MTDSRITGPWNTRLEGGEGFEFGVDSNDVGGSAMGSRDGILDVEKGIVVEQVVEVDSRKE